MIKRIKNKVRSFGRRLGLAGLLAGACLGLGGCETPQDNARLWQGAAVLIGGQNYQKAQQARAAAALASGANSLANYEAGMAQAGRSEVNVYQNPQQGFTQAPQVPRVELRFTETDEEYKERVRKIYFENREGVFTGIWQDLNGDGRVTFDELTLTRTSDSIAPFKVFFITRNRQSCRLLTKIAFEDYEGNRNVSDKVSIAIIPNNLNIFVGGDVPGKGKVTMGGYVQDSFGNDFFIGSTEYIQK